MGTLKGSLLYPSKFSTHRVKHAVEIFCEEK